MHTPAPNIQNLNENSERSQLDQNLHTPVVNRQTLTAKQNSDKSQNRSFVQKAKSPGRHEEILDPKTGRPYFHPINCRSPISRPTEMKNYIGEHLYNQHSMINEKHKKLQKEELKLAEMRRSILQNNKKTEIIVDQNKRHRLNDIFDIFDSDQDGIISAQKVDLHSLLPDILEIFSPSLFEMEEIGTTLDSDELIDASLRLFGTLNINDRNKILQFRRMPKSQVNHELKNCTFQPELNNKSLKMAYRSMSKEGYSQHDANDSSDILNISQLGLAQRLSRKKQESELKIMREREEKEKNELVGCTFHPNIQNKSNVGSNQFYGKIYTFGGTGVAGGSMDRQNLNNLYKNQLEMQDDVDVDNNGSFDQEKLKQMSSNMQKKFQNYGGNSQQNGYSNHSNTSNPIELVEIQQ